MERPQEDEAHLGGRRVREPEVRDLPGPVLGPQIVVNNAQARQYRRRARRRFGFRRRRPDDQVQARRDHLEVAAARGQGAREAGTVVSGELFKGWGCFVVDVERHGKVIRRRERSSGVERRRRKVRPQVHGHRGRGARRRLDAVQVLVPPHGQEHRGLPRARHGVAVALAGPDDGVGRRPREAHLPPQIGVARRLAGVRDGHAGRGGRVRLARPGPDETVGAVRTGWGRCARHTKQLRRNGREERVPRAVLLPWGAGKAASIAKNRSHRYKMPMPSMRTWHACTRSSRERGK